MLRALKKVFGKKNKAKEPVERHRADEEKQEYGDDIKWNNFDDDSDSQGNCEHEEELHE